ncbi:MAG: sialate O-acetylesterase [Planctomycetota bacterium]
MWGKLGPGEIVQARIADRDAQTTTQKSGDWSLELDALPVGGPHELHITGEKPIVIRDVFVGEVWLRSGQSNMAMTAEYCSGFEESRAAADLPQIRMFRESSGPAEAPQWKGKGEWTRCSPETVGEFSGTLWFLGRALHEALKRPVGLLDASMSNTPIQCWISADAQWKHKRLQPFVALEDAAFRSFDSFAARSAYKSEVALWQGAVAAAALFETSPPQKATKPVESYRHKAASADSSMARLLL